MSAVKLVRDVTAKAYAAWLIKSGKVNAVLNRLNSGSCILSIYFHNPSLKVFEGCIKWILKNNLRAISTSELYAIYSNKKNLPRNTVVITVDDGWKFNEQNVIQTAIRYRIPVTIFLATDPMIRGNSFWWTIARSANKKMFPSLSVEELKGIPNHLRLHYLRKVSYVLSERQAMTSEAVRYFNSSPYINFQSHTVSHPILPMCTDQEVLNELVQSRLILERQLDKPIQLFAYPNGSYGIREINMLKRAGYKMAFTTQTNYIDHQSLVHPFEIPRFEVLDDSSMEESICRMTGVWFNTN